MEKERRKLDKQLDVVQEKTKRAYLSQEILEAKMKVLAGFPIKIKTEIRYLMTWLYL